MTAKGTYLSEESKSKISLALKGRKLSSERRLAMSQEQKGRKNSAESKSKASSTLKQHYKLPENRSKLSQALKGHKVSPEARVKISEALTGKSLSKEHRKSISKAKLGYYSNMTPEARAKLGKHFLGTHTTLGYKFTPEQRRKCSVAQTGKRLPEPTKARISSAVGKFRRNPENKPRISGTHCSAWRGGIQYEPYDSNFTPETKEAIRTRDSYTCQLCGALQSSTPFAVHHIDYHKKNSNLSNLITLCNSCHSRTNSNRKYWEKYFKAKIERKTLKCPKQLKIELA